MNWTKLIEVIGAMIGRIGTARLNDRIAEIDAQSAALRRLHQDEIDAELKHRKELEHAEKIAAEKREAVMDRIDRADTIAGIDEAMRGRR